MRLFCFPYAGGGASAFHALAQRLPTEIEVWAVQLPGRENRFAEPAFTCMDSLVSSLAKVLPDYLDRPYAFFGHSMGALISFELARALRREGQIPEPFQLIASAHRAPHLPDPRPAIHKLPNEHFLAKLRRFNGTPEEILQHEELLHILLPLLRADFELCETYVYTADAPLTCPIHVLGGLWDQAVSRESLLAWNELTSGPFTTNFFPGDHFFIRSAQRDVLNCLAQNLLAVHVK